MPGPGPAGPVRRRPPARAGPLLVCIGLVCVLLVQAARKRTLYAWDELTFWARAVVLSRLFRRNAVASVAEVFRSFRQEEYNLLPSVGPAALMAVIGIGRVAYVAAITLLYVPVTVIVWTKAVRRQRQAVPVWLLLIAILPLLLCPGLWEPLLRGYPDAGGLVLVVGAFGLYLLLLAGRRRLAALAGVGIALALLGLFRRWYLYWVVGFALAVVGDVLVRTRGGGVRIVSRELAVVGLAIGLSGLAVAVATFGPLLWTMSRTDYGAIYAGYQEASYGRTLVRSAAAVTGRVGLVPLGISVLAIVADLLFNRMNTLGELGPHPLYLLLPTLLLPVSLWLARSDGHVRLRAGLVVALCAVNYVSTLCGPVAFARWPLLSDVSLGPAKRDDLPELERLLDRLSAAVRGTRDRIYVLGTSKTLNATHLIAADLSLGRPIEAAAHVVPSHEVDSRDGFPSGLFVERFVVVATPAQLHLRAAEQQVVALPVRDFETGTGVAAAFIAWPQTFTLENGVTVRVFERRRLSTRAEASTLLAALRDAHPDRAESFFLPPWLTERLAP